jgi:hypothetical protein
MAGGCWCENVSFNWLVRVDMNIDVWKKDVCKCMLCINNHASMHETNQESIDPPIHPSIHPSFLPSIITPRWVLERMMI